MRTIKFRGKSLFRGEWRVGSLITCANGRVFIVEAYEYVSDDSMLYWEVDPATVGQFTGLTDKDGKEIYEGDIVETFIGNLEIIWSQGLACYRLQDGGGGLYSIDGMEMEVVGDIHDNPELLTE